MGAEKERIRVIELGGADVRAALNRFDAASTQCYHTRDRQRLLAVVEAGFGDLTPFNLLVRSVFADARFVALEQQVEYLLAKNSEQQQRLDFLEEAHRKAQRAIVDEDTYVQPLEC